jgi:replicative DNA helicase
MDGRLPPSDIQAEEAVLGSCLIDEGAILLVDLQPEDFFSQANKWVFEAMLQVPVINQVTVARQLSKNKKLEEVGGAAYISHLVANTPSSLHAEWYAKIVRETALQRRLISAADKIAAIGYEGGDVNEFISKAYAQLSLVEKSTPKRHIYSSADLSRDAWADYSIRREKTQVIPTGIKKLDEVIKGLLESEYVIFGAATSVGKTQTAIQIMASVAGIEPTAIFSLEQTRKQLTDRLVSQMTGIPILTIVRGLYNEKELESMEASLVEMADKKFWISDGRYTTATLRRDIARMVGEHGIKVVFVDYLHMLQDTGKSLNERATFISQNLANIAKEFNIRLIVLSQLNRAPRERKDKRPLLSDLRDSGSIEQDADMIWFLYRDNYYDRHVKNSNTELIIAKDRLRGTAPYTVDLIFNKLTGRLE